MVDPIGEPTVESSFVGRCSVVAPSTAVGKELCPDRDVSGDRQTGAHVLTDRGDVASVDTDQRILVTVVESFQALNGAHASEAQLVSVGLLREESRLHDITVDGDGDYTIVPTAGP